MNIKSMSVLFVAMFFILASGKTMANNMMKFVAHAGQVLEMPVYQEPEVAETIPGSAVEADVCQAHDAGNTHDDLLNPETLSRILICITKPEIEEPFPFDIN